MHEVQPQKKGLTKSVKNGSWEVLLTDPSLNKFNFVEHLSDKYITTDILSPLGDKSILYNTVPRSLNSVMIIGLNFQDIDQTRISEIVIKASESFFKHWNVELKDNRNGLIKEVSTETVFAIEPAIDLNKLMRMGFSEQQPEQSKSYFELHLVKNSSER